MAGYDDDLRFAHVLADSADATAMDRFRALDLVVDAKPDMTPVTDADRSVEERTRAMLARARPRDAIIGEEFGATGSARRRWVIDPIDGTKNFIRGVPVWATLLALMEGDETVVGVVSAPALNRRWWASRGAGTFTGRSLSSAVRCRVSDVAALGDASLSYSSLRGWRDTGRWDAFLGLMDACWRTRAYGDFWSYMLVAEGAVDIAAEPEVDLHDLAAVDAIVTEAGGRFSDLTGSPGPGGGSGLATNGKLHDDVLAALTS